ncbi:DUF3644 domain-containing protein [Actinokineospora cianjurensis]|uniref:DUF3644 domain-containing protein n=1 Tax=Actinokineospora cianjurensis TaxID=585224 RepID=A0A421BC29_9PSEU|nr:DUF3644 domain-containing protein [Actinokineospora cianjurensis]RLK61935.1 hypothetical protein CLV68_2480 [Actinokineospora cianjurensis]
MKLKQDSRVLKRKALDSLTSAIAAFNSPHGQGRTTKVLLYLQHAFEMLLKAALVQRGTKVFDRETGRSIGFEKCVRLSAESATIKLNEDDAGTLRTIDAMRDDEQHWYNEVSEQVLYLHARAGVTLFDDILQRVFDDRLATHLPTRVLPISVDPPRELSVILNEEYSQTAALLQPGRRAGHEARARIRTLLAMEAHVQPDVRVSSKDVDRVERGIRNGDPLNKVFPQLENIATTIDGSGITLTVHFTKKQGPPVRYVADESIPAAAIREVDLLKKYHRSPTELAEALGITIARSTAVRRHLGLDQDGPHSHLFELGSMRQRRYSDNALAAMREAMGTVDIEAIWQGHKPRGRAKSPGPACTVPGCQAA